MQAAESKYDDGDDDDDDDDDVEDDDEIVDPFRTFALTGSTKA